MRGLSEARVNAIRGCRIVRPEAIKLITGKPVGNVDTTILTLDHQTVERSERLWVGDFIDRHCTHQREITFVTGVNGDMGVMEVNVGEALAGRTTVPTPETTDIVIRADVARHPVVITTVMTDVTMEPLLSVVIHPEVML